MLVIFALINKTVPKRKILIPNSIRIGREKITKKYIIAESLNLGTDHCSLHEIHRTAGRAGHVGQNFALSVQQKL